MRQSVRVVGFLLILLLSAITLASAQTGELTIAKKIQVSAFIRGNFRTVERVEAPDPYTVIIKTKAPYRPMLLGLSQLGIAPASALDAGEAYVAHPVGAGPYKFVEYVP